MPDTFADGFLRLTQHAPLRWQRRLHDDWLLQGRVPDSLDLPTGAGKTSVMALWYLARSAGAALPRRLVYVVDRRAVVDQATAEADGIARRAGNPELRISTLRGKHVDNRDWLADPSAPAIIVGTVDMIGSRLLFSGYGVSRKMRPFHAGLLGADALLVLDEAHLVPPFERLLAAIASRRKEFGPAEGDHGAFIPALRLMSLSATGRRQDGEAFRLDPDDHEDPFISDVLTAEKVLTIERQEGRDLATAMAEKAWALASGATPRRCAVYCDRRKDADAVADRLRKRAGPAQVEKLVGARRVREREAAAKSLVRLGFAKAGEDPEIAAPRTTSAFLVATSAGEVGVDLDAEDMVCDVVAWERMVQRLGRVNRRGGPERAARVVVFDPGPSAAKPKEGAEKKANEISEARREAALSLLRSLPPRQDGFDASPAALRELVDRADADPEIRARVLKAQTPEPLRPGITRALADAWSFTSMREHTGRPEVAPWLRGWVDDPPPVILWRRHLPVPEAPSDGAADPGDRLRRFKGAVESYFEAAPPHLSEQLEAESWQVAEWLVKASKRLSNSGAEQGDGPPTSGEIIAIAFSRDGSYRGAFTAGDIADDGPTALARRLASTLLVVDARIGGISDGSLDAANGGTVLCADAAAPQEWDGAADDAPTVPFRVRRTAPASAQARERGWRERFRFVLRRNQDDEPTEWLSVEKWREDANGDDDAAEGRNQLLAEHIGAVVGEARRIGRGLGIPERYADALALAARLHDEGKRARTWQQAFNAPPDGQLYGKTEGPVNLGLLDGYRHELGSLVLAAGDPGVAALEPNLQDLVLHLIAAHHGWARPIIPTDNCPYAPPSALTGRAQEVALRFARLQRQWGPWGLAWWESLLRAADQAASRENDRAPAPEPLAALAGQGAR
jgi:CRISPR-associated endonuclease/helicase Cas3